VLSFELIKPWERMTQGSFPSPPGTERTPLTFRPEGPISNGSTIVDLFELLCENLLEGDKVEHILLVVFEEQFEGTLLAPPEVFLPQENGLVAVYPLGLSLDAEHLLQLLEASGEAEVLFHLEKVEGETTPLETQVEILVQRGKVKTVPVERDNRLCAGEG
jgi:hypothetical protein